MKEIAAMAAIFAIAAPEEPISTEPIQIDIDEKIRRENASDDVCI